MCWLLEKPVEGLMLNRLSEMHDNDIHQTSHWTLIITWYLYHQFLIFNPTFMWKSMFSCISKNLWGLSYLGWNQLHSVSQPHDTAFEDCSSYNLEWYSNLIGEDYGCNFVFNMVAKLHGFFFICICIILYW